jgi:hypothetical protein
MFRNNYKKYGYNSFIFGSSRTLAFQPTSWHSYLSNEDVPFMFDASGESIYGVYIKLKYLDSLNVNIKNALLIICRDVTFKYFSNYEGHLYVKDPNVSGESRLKFHLEFVEAYLAPRFLANFYLFKILGEYKPYMKGYIENRKITMDTLTNEINIIDQEEEITKYPNQYYLKRKDIFYERSGEKIDSVNRINKSQLFMLKEIKRIFCKHNTNFKVVISPLYEQVKFNKFDINILKQIFQHNLYDFSGKNSFTDNKYNYYENSHYRPIVGDSILKLIYEPLPK